MVLHRRNQSVIAPFSSLLLTEVPILEELVVSVESTGGKNDPDDKRWSRCGLIRAPILNRVAISHMDERIAGLQLPWSQMTHLSFELSRRRRVKSLSANETIGILRQCPNLVSIQVEIGNIAEEFEAAGINNLNEMDQFVPAPVHNREALIMHHLLHLTIHTALDLSEFFPVIQTPVLREFSFFGIPLPALGIPSVISFLSWVPTLKRLSIDPRCFTLEQVSQCLASCPMITSLRFCTGFVDDEWCRSSFARRGLAKCDDATMALITPSLEGEERDEYLCRYLQEFYAIGAFCTGNMVYNFMVTRQKRAQNGYPRLKVVSVDFFEKPRNRNLLDTLRDVDDVALTYYKPTYLISSRPHRCYNSGVNCTVSS